MSELDSHKPAVVLVDDENNISEIRDELQNV
jgi:aspartate 1-decarboxylase